MKNKIIAIAAFFGLLAVIAGALGAHFLKDKLDAYALKSFETGVKFMMYHSLYIFMLSALVCQKNWHKIKLLLWLTIFGVLFFSGSIFLLSTISITEIELLGVLGPITPIGGLLLVLNWVILLYYGLVKKIFKDKD